MEDIKYVPEEWRREDDFNRTRAHLEGRDRENHQVVVVENGYGLVIESNEQELEEYNTKVRTEYENMRNFLWNAEDQWKYSIDNDFAKAFLGKTTRKKTLPSFSYSSELCKRCTTISLSQSFDMVELKNKLRPCLICRMQARYSQGVRDRNEIINRKGPLRLCAPPDRKSVHPHIQQGLPVLPKSDSSTRFELFREWIELCNRDHDGCSIGSSSEFPTRVIDVGSGNEVKTLHLCDLKNHNNYVALSHCWGNLPMKQKKIFCTSKENISERQTQGFELSVLPQTFQDAVTVTRKLGVRYLWIDSLCIIQYGDELEDWKKESVKMESVFRNAYCTVAASTASDSTQGFLHRPRARESGVRYIKVQTSSHGPLYISTVGDNFSDDVEKAVLNQRAWVLQERALSRRTIHFTSTQAYWECGEGVRCETLSYMRNSKALFLGDPKFPESLNFRSTEDKIKLFQFLFVRYCQLSLTNSTDKPHAISGLEQRLAKTFDTKSKFGVLEKFFHRSLLWQRSGPTAMTRIKYDSGSKVPSWSWMAYSGHIEYLEVGIDLVQWNEGVKLVDDTLRSKVGSFQNCRVIREKDGICTIEGEHQSASSQDSLTSDEAGRWENGWLRYDGKTRRKWRNLRIVVLGKNMNKIMVEPDRPAKLKFGFHRRQWKNQTDAWKHYILIVAPEMLDGKQVFRRVGIGFVPPHFVSFEKGAVEQCII